VLLGGRRLLRGTRANNQSLNAQEAGAMVSRTQLDRLAARIEALVANPMGRPVVVDRSETPEQALDRLCLARPEVSYFVHTGSSAIEDCGRAEI
jgi:hypothetical protein